MNKKYPANVEDDIEDSALFRESMVDVERTLTDKVSHRLPKPPPHPQQSRADEAKVMREIMNLLPDPVEVQFGDSVSFNRPGVQYSVMRKLRKGQYRVSMELDLHGFNSEQAKFALQDFIFQARTVNARCVRIIHGKGHRSSNQGPVLKPLVNRWLQQWDDILAFCSAKPADGGTGAVYVLLKS